MNALAGRAARGNAHLHAARRVLRRTLRLLPRWPRVAALRQLRMSLNGMRWALLHCSFAPRCLLVCYLIPSVHRGAEDASYVCHHGTRLTQARLRALQRAVTHLAGAPSPDTPLLPADSFYFCALSLSLWP